MKMELFSMMGFGESLLGSKITLSTHLVEDLCVVEARTGQGFGKGMCLRRLGSTTKPAWEQVMMAPSFLSSKSSKNVVHHVQFGLAIHSFLMESMAGPPTPGRIEIGVQSRSFCEMLDSYMAQVMSWNDKYTHINERTSRASSRRSWLCKSWLEDQIMQQAESPKNVKPVLKSTEIGKKWDEVIYFATPILTRRKPKSPVVPGGTPGMQTPKSSKDTVLALSLYAILDVSLLCAMF
ncbi:hypothetical protein B0H17DRAFT_1144462 [Mycena rosella]|uniref:Uncharacterized protein n=1 Tax=Mycena rosella TaxID=1033263 RepID=A0AAD7CTX7_MYCRO|nr:hypothetical protein B0H17DRAFT_1144462 [Mycena rosella]